MEKRMNTNGTDPQGSTNGNGNGARSERTQIMTTKEIAKYLGVHEMTVYRWLKKGVLPGFKIGGRWRSKKDLLDNYLTRQMEEK
jgi:excisionase family DNA binding protein